MLCHGAGMPTDEPAAQPTSTARQGSRRRRLKPGTAVLWRDRNTLQLEHGTRRIVVEPLDTAAVRHLLDGDQTGTDAALSGLRNQLDALGFLDDPAPHVQLHAVVVDIDGRSRIAPLLGSALAAAGVGQVRNLAAGEANHDLACPGGALPSDEGRPFRVAFDDAITRAVAARRKGGSKTADSVARPASGARPAAVRGRRRGRPAPSRLAPDLTILTEYGPIEPAVRDALHVEGRTHLVVSVDEDRAIIGPLVVPGVTSCLRCLDLHRCDRDPAWPLLAVQLATTRHRRRTADIALCLAAAGVATSQVLTFLSGETVATMGSTLEWHSPDWRLRRRRWPPHPQCDCGASARSTHARHNEAVIVQ